MGEEKELKRIADSENQRKLSFPSAKKQRDKVSVNNLCIRSNSDF